MDSNESRETERRKILAMALISADIESSGSTEDSLIQCFLSDNNSKLPLGMVQVISRSTKRTCTRNFVGEIVPSYTDWEFKQQFRVSRELCEHVVERFEEHKLFEEARYDKHITALKQVLMFLWFAGNEEHSMIATSKKFTMSLCSVYRIIKRVTMFVSSLSEEVIRFPNAQEIGSSSHCETTHKISKVIGAVGGTQISIQEPAKDKYDYVNYKGHASVCLQAICNEKRKFFDIFVGYPGSVPNSIVFERFFDYSRLDTFMKDYVIVADSAFPLKTNVMTPYKDNGHLTAAQRNFNKTLRACAVVAEHSFEILRQRFRQLHHIRLRGIKNVCHFIRACCVLHNLASEDDLEFEEAVNYSEPHETAKKHDDTKTAEAVRDHICGQLWGIKENI